MEYIVGTNIIRIEDIDEVIERVEVLVEDTISKGALLEHIKDENSLWYFDNKLNIVEDPAVERSSLLWVDTGYVDKDCNTIFISLMNKHTCFTGNFVGQAMFLANGAKHLYRENAYTISENVKKFINRYNTEVNKGTVTHINCNQEIYSVVSMRSSETSKVSDDNSFFIANSLYNTLLYPTFRSVRGLDRYLKICGARIWDMYNDHKSEYYLLNENKTMIVINSGLINKYTEDVFIIYEIHLGMKTFRPASVVEGKNVMLEHKFTKEQTTQIKELTPVSFFDDEQDRFLKADIDDFDLNYSSLNHILQGRRSRFPENIQAMPDAEIVSKIRQNLEFGLKLLKRDPFFAKVSYSGNNNHKGIAWMLPLYLNSVYGSGKPELVMIIVKVGEFYEVKTILKYDECIEDRTIATNLYKYMW